MQQSLLQLKFKQYMVTNKIMDESRILYIPEEVEFKEEYEDIIKWGLQKAGIVVTSVSSQYTGSLVREEALNIEVTSGNICFSTYTPPANGYIAPIFLWDFLNQILDHFKPDNEYYFHETYDPAIVFLTQKELSLLVENDLTFIHPNWSTYKTQNQIRFKDNGNEITKVRKLIS